MRAEKVEGSEQKKQTVGREKKQKKTKERKKSKGSICDLVH